MSKDKVYDILKISRTEAIQALYNVFFRAKDRGAYTVKQMLADGLDELIKNTKANPKYFLISDEWESGGGLRREFYDTKEDAIKAAIDSPWAGDIVIKGEIVYDRFNVSKELKNASKN